VAEVTVRKDGSWRLDRVMCAVDCGVAVNPDIIRAQMESGIAYGLTAAMYGAITLKGGVVEQSNFHDYMPLRLTEMPRIGVYIARSDEKPTGVGEPSTPVIAPAVETRSPPRRASACARCRSRSSSPSPGDRG